MNGLVDGRAERSVSWKEEAKQITQEARCGADQRDLERLGYLWTLMFYFIDDAELDQSSSPLREIWKSFFFLTKNWVFGWLPVASLLPHFIPASDQKIGVFVKLSKRNVQKQQGRRWCSYKSEQAGLNTKANKNGLILETRVTKQWRRGTNSTRKKALEQESS